MSEKEISQKDILLQMMTDVRETRKEIVDQRLLLTKHIEASVGRDELIREIKTDVEKIEIRVGKLESFKLRIVATWSVISVFIYLAIDIFVKKIFN
jgi:hypothetical protein